MGLRPDSLEGTLNRTLRWALLTVLAALVVVVAYALSHLAEGPTRLVMSAGSKGGEYYDFARALAQLAATHGAGFTIEVRESGGAEANNRALAEGTADLALVQSDTVLTPSGRAVAGLFPEVLHVVAQRDAGIRTPADLLGKRIALMPAGSGTNAAFLRVMDHYGFATTDLTTVELPAQDAEQALLSNRVDAMVRVIALGNRGMRELLKHEDLTLVRIDQAAAIQLFAPAMERTLIPRGALSGRPAVPPEDIEALGVRAILVARENVDDAVIEALTRLLFDSRNELLALDEKTALMIDGAALRRFGMPLHDGAEVYYDRDEPAFLVQYAEAIALGLSVAALVLSGAWQANRWLAARRKNRGDEYNQQLLDCVESLRAARSPEEVARIESELLVIFRAVVDDLDNDRFQSESLPSFTMIWDLAKDLIARRRAEFAANGGK
ncbi:MAG: TAXI family TRAP transporter solute-binding subunit [Betaproteobacteria bacterium]|nr:TAXI family TRAP transporter solute-binding subunit [Betaproteobacteria bacterium]